MNKSLEWKMEEREHITWIYWTESSFLQKESTSTRSDNEQLSYFEVIPEYR